MNLQYLEFLKLVLANASVVMILIMMFMAAILHFAITC